MPTWTRSIGPRASRSTAGPLRRCSHSRTRNAPVNTLKHSLKMFAIAAAPVVRAAATVKASKAAAKEQKSACAPAPISRGVVLSIGKTGIVSPRSHRPRRFSASLDARTANVSAARVRRVTRRDTAAAREQRVVTLASRRDRCGEQLSRVGGERTAGDRACVGTAATT